MIKLPFISRLFSSNWTQNAFVPGSKQISTHATPLQFRFSPILWAEPLKKKKKVDPALVKAKEEKKKKKLMKEIRKLQRLEKPLKPVAELEIPSCILEEPEKRKRIIKVSHEIAEERELLLKKWAAFKSHGALSDVKLLSRLMKAQEEALNELRLESEELYQAAVRIDTNLIPFKYEGPTETPPIQDYPQPDGAYTDVSKKWL